MAKYENKNGLQFDTVAEQDAYIRGLELVRQEGDLNAVQHKKFAEWLDDAHTQKAIATARAKSESEAAEKAREAAMKIEEPAIEVPAIEEPADGEQAKEQG